MDLGRELAEGARRVEFPLGERTQETRTGMPRKAPPLPPAYPSDATDL